MNELTTKTEPPAPHVMVIAVGTLVLLVLVYLGVAFSTHWFPFDQSGPGKPVPASSVALARTS